MSEAFDRVCEGVERGTSLDRMQSRGTVRLALKEAGLDPARVQPNEMAVVLRRILPGALRARGVETADDLCAEIARGVAGLQVAPQADTPDAIFSRLAR
jgi:hypothetical protein